MSGTDMMVGTRSSRVCRRPGRPSRPQRALLNLIAAYQRFVSPALPVVTLGTCTCRFTPSCSHYAAEAVATHGTWRGTWLAVRRLLKCGPWHPGGSDPVPACESVKVATAGSASHGRAVRATLPSDRRGPQCVAVS